VVTTSHLERRRALLNLIMAPPSEQHCALAVCSKFVSLKILLLSVIRDIASFRLSEQIHSEMSLYFYDILDFSLLAGLQTCERIFKCCMSGAAAVVTILVILGSLRLAPRVQCSVRMETLPFPLPAIPRGHRHH
jgi:hypothetical protein